jgi:hypothetical protein
MDYFAAAMTTSYNNITLIPNWLLYIITGALGSFFIGILHRSPKIETKPKPKPRVAASQQVSPTDVATTTAAENSKPVTKRTGTKTKKNGKK